MRGDVITSDGSKLSGGISRPRARKKLANKLNELKNQQNSKKSKPDLKKIGTVENNV